MAADSYSDYRWILPLESETIYTHSQIIDLLYRNTKVILFNMLSSFLPLPSIQRTCIELLHGNNVKIITL